MRAGRGGLEDAAGYLGGCWRGRKAAFPDHLANSTGLLRFATETLPFRAGGGPENNGADGPGTGILAAMRANV
jgi:hypothetical protein